MSGVTTIDLIRHGEPVGGRAYRGHGVDDPLSDRGWAQMRAAVADAAPWQAVISSPLLRCRAFAEELARRHRLPLAVDERFKEVGFGTWEGRTAERIRVEHPDQWAAFQDDPVRGRPPGAEPLDAFVGRVSDALEEAAARHAGERLLVVAHAGVIRAAVVHAVGAPLAAMYRMRITNAGFATLTREAGRWTLRRLNAPSP